MNSNTNVKNIKSRLLFACVYMYKETHAYI